MRCCKIQSSVLVQAVVGVMIPSVVVKDVKRDRQVIASFKWSRKCGSEVEPRNRPTQIEIIENVHKGQKGKGEWRDSKEEKEALDIGYLLSQLKSHVSKFVDRVTKDEKHLNAICAKYFVPEEVHPQLPSPDATMHERPTGKVGIYTRFFDYANYRIPFPYLLLSVLTHITAFRFPNCPCLDLPRFLILKSYAVFAILSLMLAYSATFIHTIIRMDGLGSLSVLMSALAIPRILDSVKNWNDHFFWVDEFVVPANARFKMDLNAFIRTADPRKVRVVERARAENERPIVTMAKHRTVTLLPTTVARSSGELSASVEREFVGDAGTGDGGDQGFDSVAGGDNVEPTVPVTEPVEAEIPRPKRSKKKRVIYDSEGLPVAPHPPKRLRADYGNTGSSATGGKSLSALNRLLQDSRLTVEQGVPALPTLPFITSSVTKAFHTSGVGGDRTDSVTGPSLRTIGPSARFVVLSDSSHHSGAKSADPEVDSLARSDAPVMTEATTVTIPTDVNKDKSAPHPSVFGSSSSSEKTDRTLSLFAGRSGSGFDAGSIRAEEAIGAGSEEIYIPEWTVTKGFGMNDGRLCANMIDHFTPPAFFKTVRGMEHEQLFTEFNVSAARNLSLSSEVRMRAEYNILEKRKWRSLAEEKNILLEAKDKEIEDLKSQLLKAKEESAEVTRLRAQVSGLEAAESSLRGEVASAHDHNVLLEQERNSLKLKVTGLESIIAEKDKELSDLGASSSSLKSQNQSLVDQVHELEVSSADLREKLETYEGSLKQLEEFQDNLMGPLRTRLAEIDADFTRCCMRFQESFHPHLLNVIAGRRWLLTHGMKLLVGLSHKEQAWQMLNTDLEAYIPSAEDDFNSAIRDLHDLNFPLLQELSNKKDASTWDIMDLLRLDDTVAETLGMTDLQPNVDQLMVPVHHKRDRVIIGSQALSVALNVCRGRVEKMERNLIERLPFLKDVFASIEDPLSAEALIEPSAEVPATNVLSTVVIVPPPNPSISVEDYDNPDPADVVPENTTSGLEREGKIDSSAGGGLTFSQLDDEARDAVL
ncbi:hypothetical protein Tco_0858216 [Tanacetum coccineum]|uniref:Transposase (Putative), gypsy type n=1 Tax=Tanacetum coccineum TaxID=301880 RepID=A0ABQ5BCL7_9ASTR